MLLSFWKTPGSLSTSMTWSNAFLRLPHSLEWLCCSFPQSSFSHTNKSTPTYPDSESLEGHICPISTSPVSNTVCTLHYIDSFKWLLYSNLYLSQHFLIYRKRQKLRCIIIKINNNNNNNNNNNKLKKKKKDRTHI